MLLFLYLATIMLPRELKVKAERKFEDVVKSAQAAAVLVLVY